MQRFENSIKNHSSALKPPLIYFNEVMYDIKGWLEPFVNDFHGHTGPHIFFVFRDEFGHAIFKYKKWSSTNEQWKPEEGIHLFKVSNHSTHMYIRHENDAS